MERSEIQIASRNYWFKIVDFLQQNWALIDKTGGGYIIYFFGDTSGVFDSIEYDRLETAENELRLNGFREYDKDASVQTFLHKPPPLFHQASHPNGKIYSSGRYWKCCDK